MKIYMNNAATSYPKPACVGEAVKACLERPPGAAHRSGIEDFDLLQETRAQLSALLGGVDPDRIALTANATQALNLALFGLDLLPSDRVLTSDGEHNSVYRPLHVLAGRGINTLYAVTDDVGRIQPEVFAATIGVYRPRLVVFTHASNVTGAVNDAKTLADIAHQNGCLVLLDASQTLGLVPVDAQGWGLDLVAFTGHKYMLGPQGTGGLYVREGLSLTPHLVGGTGIFSDLPTMPADMPLRLEAGTGNEPGCAGLRAALLWAKAHPLDEAALWGQLERLRRDLQQAGANVIDPSGPCTPVVSFVIDGWDCDAVGYVLSSYDIVCRTGLHCAPRIHERLRYNNRGTVRLSLSRFTTDAEVNAVVRAVRDIVRQKPL